MKTRLSDPRLSEYSIIRTKFMSPELKCYSMIRNGLEASWSRINPVMVPLVSSRKSDHETNSRWTKAVSASLVLIALLLTDSVHSREGATLKHDAVNGNLERSSSNTLHHAHTCAIRGRWLDQYSARAADVRFYRNILLELDELCRVFEGSRQARRFTMLKSRILSSA